MSDNEVEFKDVESEVGSLHCDESKTLRIAESTVECLKSNSQLTSMTLRRVGDVDCALHEMRLYMLDLKKSEIRKEMTLWGFLVVYTGFVLYCAIKDS